MPSTFLDVVRRRERARPRRYTPNISHLDSSRSPGGRHRRPRREKPGAASFVEKFRTPAIPETLKLMSVFIRDGIRYR
jgi:hypothetical protein